MRKINIAGGGLAGLALGICLRKADVPCQIYEAHSYPRHRVCGEFISGLDARDLESLGVSSEALGAKVLSTTAWFSANRKLRSDELPTSALGLSRWRMDKALADSFTARGGKLTVNHRYRLNSKEGLIDCTGRTLDRSSKWIGLKCHLKGFKPEADLEMHFSDGGYVGISKIEGDDKFNLCGLFKLKPKTRKHQKPLISSYLVHCGLQSLAIRVDESEFIEGSESAVSGLAYGADATKTFPALGDAAGLIPPFTGNGMSLAIESAFIAMPTLLHYSMGQIEWPECCARIAQSRKRQFRKRLLVARLMHSGLTNVLGLRALTALSVTPFLPFNLLYRLTRS